jgi:hypothetical protein
LVHPLIHSFKIFAYVFVINMLFGVLLYYVGDEKITDFLSSNYYFSPSSRWRWVSSPTVLRRCCSLKATFSIKSPLGPYSPAYRSTPA